jgi:hypothetical protein
MKLKLMAVAILAGCVTVPMLGQSRPASLWQGVNLRVNCGQKVEGTLPTINAALKLLSPAMSNTVTVSGTCNENVLIQGFDRLTLISTTGATINDASGGQNSVVDIEDSRRVTLQGFTINGGFGLGCGSASVCYLTANTIQFSSAQQGIGISDGSRAYLTNNVIKNNSGRGLTINNGSQVFSTTDTFQGNGDLGVAAGSGAFFVAVNSIIEDNGSDGVSASDHSALRLISCTISGNTGNGVSLVHNSEARFDSNSGAATVSANAGSGVLVKDLSFAFFGLGGNVTGNLGGTDVVCAPQFPATRGALKNIGGGTTNCVEPQSPGPPQDVVPTRGVACEAK